MRSLHHNIESYQLKKLKVSLTKGLIFSILLIVSYLITISALEYFFWLGTSLREILWYSLLLVSLIVFILFFVRPLFNFYRFTRNKNYHIQLALEIGKQIPDIKDKLVNALQLETLAKTSDLAKAGLDQKQNWLSVYSFKQLVQFQIPKRVKLIGLGLLIIYISFAFAWPGIYKEGTYRISRYNEAFSPKAPFDFVWINKDQKAFFQSEHKIELLLAGDYRVEEAYVFMNDRLIRMERDSLNRFSFIISAIQGEVQFQFFAGGFYSSTEKIDVFYKPNLENLVIEVFPPSYTGLPYSKQQNNGNLIIQEGSKIKWTINSGYTDAIYWLTDNDSMAFIQNSKNEFFYSRNISNPLVYEIVLENTTAKNENFIQYEIDVIKDNAPTIECIFYPDTILFEYIVLVGVARDDFGIGRLAGVMEEASIKRDTLLRSKNGKEENFYVQFELTDEIRSKRQVKFYISAWDNDAINGPKETISHVYTLTLPSEDEIKNNLNSKKTAVENALSNSEEKVNSITEKLEEVEKRLLTKPSLEWQEEKLLNEIVNQREQIQKNIEELNEKMNSLNESENKFSDRSENIQKKAKELEELMATVLDEETKKLYDQLQALLKEKGKESEIRDLVSKLSNKEKNLEKELDRALELFKRLQVEAELENISNAFEKLSEQQEKVEKETGNKNPEEIADEQRDVEQKFDNLSKQLEDVNEKNELLKRPMAIENSETLQKEIQDELSKASESIQKNQKKEAKQSMKKAAESMKKMASQMASMQTGMEMEMMEENIVALENILDNLIKSSFTQETLFNSIKEVNLSDPRMITLSQEQLQLQENTKVLEDSLLALAQRVMSISNFVTREVNEVNRHLSEAINHLRDRDKAKAVTSQQFVMTSINNLALLLSDILKQMQMAMNEAMGNPSPGKGKPKDGLPSMQQLQDQLSQQIQQLKQGQKSGRQLSEELAKMAAEQEMLRQQMEDLKEQLNNQPGGTKAADELNKAIELMEKNEIDLVNKRINQSLFDRQQEIRTRLLEAEKSTREQDTDEERESEVAQSIEKRLPPAVEEYLKNRQKELELIKNIPIPLTPFYKKEVNDYFRRLSNQQP